MIKHPKPKTISPQEMWRKLNSENDTALLVCIYDRRQYDRSHLEGSISAEELIRREPALSKDTEIYFY